MIGADASAAIVRSCRCVPRNATEITGLQRNRRPNRESCQAYPGRWFDGNLCANFSFTRIHAAIDNAMRSVRQRDAISASTRCDQCVNAMRSVRQRDAISASTRCDQCVNAMRKQKANH
jgi:bacterioferritin-associated ferredoxin